MSTIHSPCDQRESRNDFRLPARMTAREQLLGTLVVILVTLLAILLQSM